MSLPALPTNRDENWRYANLRALAKARVEAAPAAPAVPSVALPAALPGFQRWVFVDGRCSESPASTIISLSSKMNLRRPFSIVVICSFT